MAQLGISLVLTAKSPKSFYYSILIVFLCDDALHKLGSSVQATQICLKIDTQESRVEISPVEYTYAPIVH